MTLTKKQKEDLKYFKHNLWQNNYSLKENIVIIYHIKKKC